MLAQKNEPGFAMPDLDLYQFYILLHTRWHPSSTGSLIKLIKRARAWFKVNTNFEHQNELHYRFGKRFAYQVRRSDGKIVYEIDSTGEKFYP